MITCICQELSLVKSSPSHQNTIKGILLIFLITDWYNLWSLVQVIQLGLCSEYSDPCQLAWVQNILILASWLGFRIFCSLRQLAWVQNILNLMPVGLGSKYSDPYASWFRFIIFWSLCQLAWVQNILILMPVGLGYVGSEISDPYASWLWFSWFRFINSVYSSFVLFSLQLKVWLLLWVATARNCIALGSRAVKQHAQRRIHARLLKDD